MARERKSSLKPQRNGPAAAPANPSWLLRQIATLYPGTFAHGDGDRHHLQCPVLRRPPRAFRRALCHQRRRLSCLLAATLIRAVRFGPALWADLINPRLVFSFFTIVAGTDVFGIGVNLRGYPGAGAGALAVRARAVVLPDLSELRRAHLPQHRAWRQCRARRLADRHRRHRIAGHPRHAGRPAARCSSAPRCSC